MRLLLKNEAWLKDPNETAEMEDGALHMWAVNINYPEMEKRN